MTSQPFTISLDSLHAADRFRRHETGGDSGGCSSSSCGSSAKPDDMDAATWERIKDHPCYSEEAHHYFARMHVAVAPACNIQCNYCNRKYDCANESRPGVVSEKLTPDEARARSSRSPTRCRSSRCSASPAPATPATTGHKTQGDLRRRSRSEIPDIKLCISTNGLALPDHVDELAEHERRPRDDHHQHGRSRDRREDLSVDLLSSTSATPGVEAAQILHERQMLGLEMLTARGILDQDQFGDDPRGQRRAPDRGQRWVKARGAFLHNVMPLISDPAHGTHFGLTGQRGPTAMELKALQDKLEGGAKLMRHCRQCRADAVGLLGEDRGQEFTLDQLPEEVAYDPSKRAAYREIVAEERGDHVARQGRRRSPRSRRTPPTAGRSWSRSRPRAAAASTSISATPANSRSTRPRPRASPSSAIAGSTPIAWAASARTRRSTATSPRSRA